MLAGAIRNRGATMLLVIADDDRDAAESLAELLHVYMEQPLEIRLAFDGTEAVAAATKPGVPNAVIMDIEMPRMNGFDAPRAIRQALGHATTLISVSGHAGRTRLADETSAFEYSLLKPIVIDELVALLRSAPRSQSD